MDNNFLVEDAPSKTITPSKEHTWKVLIADDEQDIHTVTKLALSGFTFEGRSLELLSAHSGAEAKEIIAKVPDIAMVLLDVVMEKDQAGLEVVKYIRDELKNISIRIILRTGQPGQAPEQKVIRDYDINDYKYKSELTASKLYTLCYASLRAFRDIQTLIKSKKGLEKLIRASRGISSRQALDSFVFVTLKQLVSLLNLDDTSIFSCETEAYKLVDQDLEVFSDKNDLVVREIVKLNSLSPEKKNILSQAMTERANVIDADHMVMYCANANHTILFYAKTEHLLSELDRHIIGIFTENLIVILENIRLNEMIDESQREMIYRLGEVVESRSNETGSHVKRVAHFSELLAILIGLPKDEAEMIKLASPLHDIGKIAIPDAILQKAGKLDDAEWTVMKTHAQKGFDILKDAKLIIMNLGATIALSHHEKWDGTGYPSGLAKGDIPLHGRITALVDVFDALGSDRCYKKAWPHEDVLQYLTDQSGKHFDPRLVSLMLDNMEQFIEIRDKFQDH